MTIQRYKVALNAARFPLVSTKGSRAVFTPGLDSAPRTPRSYMGNEVSADYNTTQLVYGENIVPLSEGYGSVNYINSIAATSNTDFTNIFPLRDADENAVLYSPSKGKNYIYDSATGWASQTFATIFPTLTVSGATLPANSKVSYAYVEGYTFVCYSRLLSTTGVDMSIMLWNPGTSQLESADSMIDNPPFVDGTIDGIAASNGYLIIWSDIEIAWAPIDLATGKFNFINFANGDYTGAGSQIPEDVKGSFRAIVGVSGGFLAFTNKNCIAANYHAQNLVAPWLFREVAGAGGIESFEQLTVEGSLGMVYGYTTAGFQKVTLNSAETLHPQVADFISGRQYEKYNTTLNLLTTYSSSADLAIKVTNIGNRYVAISYGMNPNEYEFVLLLDLHLERWGKLRFDHVDCFNFVYVPSNSSLTYSDAAAMTYASMSAVSYGSTRATSSGELVAAPHSLGLLTASGAIYIANWDTTVKSVTDLGVVVIGRVQMSRSRNTQINRIEVEGLHSGDVFVVPSSDGRSLNTAVAVTPISVVYDYFLGGTMIDCKNFNIAIAGTFDLSTIIVESNTTGQF